jgi:general secretion pathway protein L
LLFFALRASYDGGPVQDPACDRSVPFSIMSTQHLNIVRWQEGQGFLLRPGHAPEQLDAESLSLPEQTCLALPSDAVRSLTVAVAPEEIKHLRQALPFMLEESLVEDVTSLHFAHRPLNDELHAVAIVQRSAMQAWQDSLPEALRETPWVSEALCLPWSPGQCTVVFEADSALVRWGEAEGARIELALLSALLSSLQPLSAVIAYGQDQESAMSMVPEPIQPLVQWRQGGLSEALLLADAGSLGPDLRQGAFAPQLPFKRWWSVWQRVAIVLALAVFLKTGVSVADYEMLKAEDLQLRQAIQDSYRRINPRGQVVDVEKQLNRQLAEFGAGAQTRAFTPVLVEILSAAALVEGVVLTSVNYSGGRDARINLSAPDFQSVEKLRDQLAKRSLSAELENSNARQDGVMARLRVEI